MSASEDARRPRTLGITLRALCLLAVTATSAAVTVAVGRPAEPKAVAAPAKPAVPSATPTAAPTPAPSAPPSPTPAPTPSSTVHGTVDGATHGGDLRYFLLPLPGGAESYGSPDGNTLSTDDVVSDFSNKDQMKSVLDSYGYQNDAADRRYRTADGKQEVYVRLLRFRSHAMAKDFAKGMQFKDGDSFSVDGDSDAQGILLKPDQEAFTGEMIGVSSSGDVEYEVRVYVKGTPDKALLADAMKRQRERLATGG